MSSLVRGIIPLSVTDGNQYSIAEHFRDLLRWYVPPPAKIIDLTCGYKIMYQKLLDHTIDNCDYEFVFNDRKKGLGDLQIDILKDKIPYPDGSFDCVIVDPPFPKLVEDYSRLEKYGGNVTRKYCLQVVAAAGQEAYRLLNTNRFFILKMQDRFDQSGRIFDPLHITCYNLLSDKFSLFDLTLYRYWSRSIVRSRHRFKKLQCALRVHSYHMIFQKQALKVK